MQVKTQAKKWPHAGAKRLKEECATKHRAIITQQPIKKYNELLFALSSILL